MEEVMKDESFFQIPKVGDIVKGKVISASKNEVHMDIDGFRTGIVRGYEVFDESGEYSDLTVGSDAEATVLELENENGEMELSFLKAGHRKAWSRLDETFKKREIVRVKITNANKGGLMAKYGKIVGFLPVSQLTAEHYPRVDGGDKSKILEKLNKLINQDLEVKIIDVSETDEKLIFSEKAAWEERQHSTISKYKVGDNVEGKVSGIVDFGVFVKFDEGLEGLVHISELAWQRIDNPHDILKLGDRIKAEIINIEGSKISLSIKKLQVDPWKEASKKYKVSQMIQGKVLKINPFGLFVEVDKDIHGLAHVSELKNKKDGKKPLAEIAKIGDTLEFKIISIEPNEHRMGLSLNIGQ
ncbi:MAG: RNA binding S1 protein [Parcubacteria group bacterium Gr01-1014_18]|nr:MAG: RNA binding S1 protein [Parcubacteria group bacterium Greene0416_36]TSC81064.1 MAG: RNA binding S1 protein [Parcubacteria group bacterium Gr01-1014_18]TSC98798.1 MAG: RNA binding S1 protein [Parcubacteria group bacterium Greene1014_20]